jgi:hypothetical protein
MRRLRVPSCFASSTQQMNSLRAKGVMSIHAASALEHARSASRRSKGSLCTTPPGTRLLVTQETLTDSYKVAHAQANARPTRGSTSRTPLNVPPCRKFNVKSVVAFRYRRGLLPETVAVAASGDGRNLVALLRRPITRESPKHRGFQAHTDSLDLACTRASCRLVIHHIARTFSRYTCSHPSGHESQSATSGRRDSPGA